jgi:hypothetical protein
MGAEKHFRDSLLEVKKPRKKEFIAKNEHFKPALNTRRQLIRDSTEKSGVDDFVP